MSSPRDSARPSAEHRTEAAVQLGSRFMALVRTGRAYSAEHAAFRQQLENFVRLLAPLCESRATLRFDAPDGDLRLDGAPLPYQADMQKGLDQLVQEFGARDIVGVEFSRGLHAGEFASFMALFLPSERWKGSHLIAACEAAGVVHVRAVPVRTQAIVQSEQAARLALPDALGASREAWATLLVGAQNLHLGDAFDHGVELRHLERLTHPIIDALIAGERMTAALTRVAPGEPAWAHAAHTLLVTVGVGVHLGLTRRDIAELAVAAMLHDVGHGWGESGGAEPLRAGITPAPHTREGLRRVAWATTLNRTSLAVMRTAFEHHGDVLETDASTPAVPALFSQTVGIADAWVTLLSRAGAPGEWVSPSGALARVVGPLRSQWHPALSNALVRALGVYPPGQFVELDDGSLAQAIAADANDPERPWIELVADPSGARLSSAHRETIALPEGRRITRALPRDQWPEDHARAAA